MKHLPSERHTLAITVANEPGVLARVVGLFSGRGYNIESLTVAEVAADHATSRITVVTSGPPPVIEQIIAQLGRLIPVHSVADLTAQGPHVEREMALARVSGTGEARTEALRLAQLFGARVVDATTRSFMFEIADTSERVETFLALMRELGLAEVARTGVAALAREPAAAART
jgi:acetolactate synthase-1/3 small subunit